MDDNEICMHFFFKLERYNELVSISRALASYIMNRRLNILNEIERKFTRKREKRVKFYLSMIKQEWRKDPGSKLGTKYKLATCY